MSEVVDMTIRPGDAIEVRDAFGEWHPKVACSDVHLNVGDTFGRQRPWYVVKVHHEGLQRTVNWPAIDVRKAAI